VIFVDSNIPLYLLGARHPNKRRARELLDDCFDANERLVTDVEVLQEILHRYTAIDRRDAIQPAFDVLTGIVDEFFPLGVEELEGAKQIALTTTLSARDALHLEVMRTHHLDRILSFDSDFDQISVISRVC